MKIFIIDNLETKLTSLGVSSEHIQFLKQELLESNVYENYELLNIVPIKLL